MHRFQKDIILGKWHVSSFLIEFPSGVRKKLLQKRNKKESDNSFFAHIFNYTLRVLSSIQPCVMKYIHFYFGYQRVEGRWGVWQLKPLLLALKYLCFLSYQPGCLKTFIIAVAVLPLHFVFSNFFGMFWSYEKWKFQLELFG